MTATEREEEQATYLTDLNACRPESAISADSGRGVWRSVPYQTANLSGHMLIAGDETMAPEVTYRLDRAGWHGIYVGLYAERGATAVQVRLTDDAAAVVLNIDAGRDFPGQEPHSLCEVLWKEADLSGQDVHISQVCTPVGTADEPAAAQCMKAKIAYIKLVPLTEGEVSGLLVDRKQQDTHRLYAHNDAHGPLFLFRVEREEEIRREIEPYRNTDFSRLYWEMGAGDLLFHLGRAGRLPTCDGREDFERVGDRLHAESWRILRDKGLDPLRVALDYTHELGMEFHASYRPAGFYFPVPFDQWNAGGLYEKRPDLRAVAKDGSPAPRISYAYPDTRRIVIDILAEVAQHPVDGIAILFNRRPPLVGYEAPLVEGFIEEFGEDPRALPDDDERWLRYRSIGLTEFMRELRRALDNLAAEQGRARRLDISACVSNREENFIHGLDLETLVREELVDTLIPYTSAPELDSSAESWRTAEEAAYFVALTQGTACALSMSILPRHMGPEDYRRKVAMLRGAGVESFFFWDSAGACGRANYSPSWHGLRRLGHAEEIQDWLAAGEPALVPESIPLSRLGDYDLSFQTPG